MAMVSHGTLRVRPEHLTGSHDDHDRAVRAAYLDSPAEPDQEFRGFPVPVLCRQPERGIPFGVPFVDGGTGFEQQPDDPDVPAYRREMQRRAPADLFRFRHRYHCIALTR